MAAAPVVFSLPSAALPSFGAASAPLWLTLVLAQLETTTTPKPATSAPPIVAVVYPQQPAAPPPAAPPGGCNVNCPPVWEPVCSINGFGYMYNFANLCALNAQNCVSGSDFRYLYAGICRLKRR